MDLEFTPILRADTRLRARPLGRLLSGIAILLVGFGPYLAIYAYVVTRNTEPVNIPAPIQAGTVHTGPFELNAGGIYLIEYHVSSALPRAVLDCRLGIDDSSGDTKKCSEPQPEAPTAWVLRSDGRVVASGETVHWRSGGSSQDTLYLSIGDFEHPAKSRKTYELDVTLKADQPQLAGLAPRLVVEIHPIFTKSIFVFGSLAFYFGLAVLPFAIWQFGAALMLAVGRWWDDRG